MNLRDPAGLAALRNRNRSHGLASATECFTQDVHADYDTIGVFDGAEAITAVIEKTHTGMGPTVHRMSNVVVDVDVDGDRASAHTYVHAIVMVNPTSKETCRRGRVVRRPADQDHRWLAHRGARLANLLRVWSLPAAEECGQ
jgi:hypothetical protein